MIRTKAGTAVYLLCGGIFSGLGLLLLVLSAVLVANMDYLKANGSGDVELLPVVVGVLGAISAAAGAGALGWVLRKAHRKRRLLERGESVFARIIDYPADNRVRINGWPTFRVKCAYTDPAGTEHIFYSDSLWIDPAYLIHQPQVRVYTDRKSGYRDYYVDISSLFPEVRQA